MKTPLCIFTLALDAMQFLPRQLEIFKQLDRPWHWFVISGRADNLYDTSWVAKLPPRLSIDGTDEWLTSQLDNPNMTVIRRQLWPGKAYMCNSALNRILAPCVLMQVDADEFWTPDQIEKICHIFDTEKVDKMQFFCRYFVGPNIVVTTEGTWGNRIGEWNRAWRFIPGMSFMTHEPPVLTQCGQRMMSREETRSRGLVFDHFAYCDEATVASKEAYYKYQGALAGWRRLQAHQQFPTPLKPFFSWVDGNVMVDRI